ncbi:hypothetical protein [Reichenbachiella versicolor]|uniref:hypothetical protein n=1 Tax=Reichenbachiella versicolor TaxID=1821036 RepID=UPI000D6E7F5E|nr:hypothetical protein [Reichenbachiella versicolor]
MIEKLDEKEMEVATSLVTRGLQRASKALSDVIQTPITIETLDFGSDSLDDGQFPGLPIEGESSLLKTEVIGEFKGVCYLIFSESEVEKISAKCLPASMKSDNPEQYTMMQQGFVTEIDNIVSAAVITEFANYLDCGIYGNVPHLEVLEASGIRKYLESETQKYDSLVHFKARFAGDELDIAPYFTWMFQDEFSNQIRAKAAE